MRERILVIDDEPNIVWLFKEIFGDAYEVLGAQTAEDGLRAAWDHDVHLVMLDLRLPGISGLQALQEA